MRGHAHEADAANTLPQRRTRTPAAGSDSARLLALQRTAGNGAVTQMLSKPTDVAPSVQRTLADRLAEHLNPQGATPRTQTVQRTLIADLRPMVEVYGPVHYEGLMTLIRAAPVPERQAVLADTALMNMIGTRLDKTWATTVASALLAGSFHWANPPLNDFFRYFVQNTGSGPTNPASTMNCWESIMYAAYLTGTVSRAWIRQYYLIAMAQPNPNAAAYALLGWSTALPTYAPAAGRVPSTGQLVFYRTGTSGEPGHVAIYLGGGQIMSLWNRPNGIDQVQQIGINEVSGTIYYGNPPW